MAIHRRQPEATSDERRPESDTMKAVVYPKYGSVDVVRIAAVEKPTPVDDELLIRVHETVVTRADMSFRRGRPLIARLFSGVLKPEKRPGGQFVGEIEAVGKDVTLFGKGDRVFGSTVPGMGGHAEYVCLPEDGVLALLPAGMTDEEIAGICDGGLTALHFLRDKANVQRGQRVLINGASGSVGSFAVQLADYYGAEVTGVCSTANVELVRSLGAEKVIDYTEAEFTERAETYDIVFDAVGKSSFSRCKRVLTPRGVYLTTVASPTVLLQMLWTAKRRGKRAIFAAAGLRQRTEDLLFLRERIEAGEITAVVDRRYPLERIAEAHGYVENGHKKGNIVITMGQNDTTQ